MVAQCIAIAAQISLAALLLSGSVFADDQIDEPVILVATPELRDRLFTASVLIVAPIGNGQHIGFIINHPTPVKLSEMFPDHEPSKKVTEPIFLGGPENVEALFALVQRQGHASAGRLRLASDLYLEIEREKVDGVIENEYGRARFFAGVVVWQPGELEAEIHNDYWYVQDADADLVMRKTTTGMWEELVKRIRQNKNAITADNTVFFARHAVPAIRLRE
ncbi:MAG TPA: YqgE/AlgH family protein [Burkholderiales bacterium]|nr:YqgE/AlgH family protein [Burkholderiales bacterium]